MKDPETFRNGARIADIGGMACVGTIAEGVPEYKITRAATAAMVLAIGGIHPHVELRDDVETILEPGMVVSMEPMIMIPEGEERAGGYREHDILVVTFDGNENITGFPFGPGHNIVPT